MTKHIPFTNLWFINILNAQKLIPSLVLATKILYNVHWLSHIVSESINKIDRTLICSNCILPIISVSILIFCVVIGCKITCSVVEFCCRRLWPIEASSRKSVRAIMLHMWNYICMEIDSSETCLLLFHFTEKTRQFESWNTERLVKYFLKCLFLLEWQTSKSYLI